MLYANWADGEFVNALAMNVSENYTNQSFATLLEGLHTFGLFHIGLTSSSVAGLNLTYNLPVPFGVVFPNGVLAQGRGTISGTDNSTYVINFASLVPGSGSVTAYLLASPALLGLVPVEIVGPPIGHPDYDPAFAPFLLYSETVDTLLLTASLTPPDNFNTIEICRFTLIAGQTVITGVDTSHQIRAGAVLSQNGEVISADLAPTGVAATTYALPQLAVDLGGRITAATGYGVSHAGNPNGALPGVQAGISTMATLVFDYTNNVIWECIVGGIAGVAVFQSLNGSNNAGAVWIGLTSSASITAPNWANRIEVQLDGAGGGGANCIAGPVINASPTSGGGGGAGGTAWGVYVVTPGQVLSAVVGVGGAAQTVGGTTMVTGLLQATGGGGAVFQSANSSSGAAGGVGTGGTVLNTTGGIGIDGQSGGFVFAGQGGNSRWGGGGKAGNHGGLAGTAPGAGGGGAFDSSATSTPFSGGAGANGFINYRWLAV